MQEIPNNPLLTTLFFPQCEQQVGGQSVFSCPFGTAARERFPQEGVSDHIKNKAASLCNKHCRAKQEKTPFETFRDFLIVMYLYLHIYRDIAI